jgi:hypothetical protein
MDNNVPSDGNCVPDETTCRVRANRAENPRRTCVLLRRSAFGLICVWFAFGLQGEMGADVGRPLGQSDVRVKDKQQVSFIWPCACVSDLTQCRGNS